MLNRQVVIEKVRHSADRYGESNPQQLSQLLRSFSKIPESELFFGLFSFFYDPTLQGKLERQQLAGTLLYQMSPACPLNLDGAIYALPAYWDLSIEEVPWYLCKVFGKNKVQEFLEELIPEAIEGSIKNSIETMLFWVKNYNREAPNKA